MNDGPFKHCTQWKKERKKERNHVIGEKARMIIVWCEREKEKEINKKDREKKKNCILHGPVRNSFICQLPFVIWEKVSWVKL